MLRVLLVVLTALDVGRLNGLVPVLAAFPIGKVFLPLCALALVLGPGPRRRYRVLRTTQALMFFMMMCAMTLSVPFSMNRGQSFQALVAFMETAVPFVLLLAVACTDDRVLVAVTRAVVFTGAVLGAAMFTPAAKSVVGRMYLGATYDPNDIALVAVVILPFAVWLMQDKARGWRWLGAGSVAGCITIIIGSASRGGMLGLGAVLILIAMRYRTRLSLRWKIASVALLGLGLLLAPATFWRRLQTLQDPDTDYNATSMTGREAIWKRGLGYFAARPITGVGLDAFSDAEGAWAEHNLPTGVGMKWSAPHSIWIELLVETGLLGATGFLGVFLPTFRDVHRMRAPAGSRSPPEDRLRGYGEALTTAIMGFFVAGTFLTMAYSPPSMLLAGFSMAYGQLASERRRDSRSASSQSRTLTRLPTVRPNLACVPFPSDEEFPVKPRPYRRPAAE